MIIYGISFIVGGTILLVFFYFALICFVNLLHDCHINDVEEDYKKKFDLKVGLSLAITAISMASTRIISLIISE